MLPFLRSPFRYLRGSVYWLAVAVASVALLAVIASVGARLFGYSPYVMYGGSMGSTAPLGSVALIREVPAESLEVGDVIVFRPPSTGEPRQPLMHRIISVEEIDGQRVIQTKGDANAAADPEPIILKDTDQVMKVHLRVPLVGYLVHFVQTSLGWVLSVLLPATLLCLAIVRDIWRPQASDDKGRGRHHGLANR